jgi:hypothetical protein
MNAGKKYFGILNKKTPLQNISTVVEFSLSLPGTNAAVE